MAKKNTIYICSECGENTPIWRGKCPSCGEWNTLIENVTTSPAKETHAERSAPAKLTSISEVPEQTEPRVDLGIAELNRVLGGGAVPGSLILIGGEPGIGKSTLLLQTAARAARDTNVYYFSGEESARQIKMRAKRIDALADALFLCAETDIDAIVQTVKEAPTPFIVIDSLQTLYSRNVAAVAGSVSQIRTCAQKLLTLAKEENVIVFLIGHITKGGSIAGPKLLEHTVDCVLYFEGDNQGAYRIVRSVKNRFGSVDEIGIFEMRERGLIEVADASAIFAYDREREIFPGTVFTPVVEGSRVFCVEEQALVSTTVFGYPRRLAMGFDQNRLLLLAAILEKRGRIKLENQDIHVNIAEGLKVTETASDLALAMAIVSSFADKPITIETAFIGELGLSGEIRPVRFIARRLKEMETFGAKRVFIPRGNLSEAEGQTKMELKSFSNVRDVIEVFLAS